MCKTARTMNAAGEVIRHRLLGRLAGRFHRRVTLVEAGAGFGKSTLITQAVEEAAGSGIGRDVVVRVPPSGLGAEELVQEFARLLNARLRPSADAGVAQLVGLVWSVAPESICLVVDDAQSLSPQAATVLTTLVTDLPTNGHVLISGRRIPTLPVHLAAAGQVEHLREGELAFDAEERRAFGALRGPVPEAPGVEGWPALMELQRVSGQAGALQYLLEEVIGRLGPSRLHACRRLAVHTVIDDELIAAATTFDGTAAELVDGVPLSSVAPDGSARFHDLVRDAVLDLLDDAERVEASRLVGGVLERRRDFAAALRVYAAAGDHEALRRLARTIAADLHLDENPSERRVMVRRLCDLLPDALEVEVVSAIHTATEQPGYLGDRLERAAARGRWAGDGDLEALSLLHLADIAYGAADVDTLAWAASRIDALADAGSLEARRRRFVPHVWLRSVTGRHADALEYLHGLPDTALDGDTAQLRRFYHVIHTAYLGNIREALREAAALQDLPGGLYANRLGGFTWIQRWMLGELTTADLAEVVLLVDRIEMLGHVHLFVEGAATTALFHASLGEVATAQALTKRADDLAHRLPATAWAHHTVAQAHAVLALLHGDEPRAAGILTRSIPPGGIATLPRFVYGVTAALTYTLCPQTRPVWESDHAGPDHVLRREVGRALVALREREDPDPASALPWDQPDLLRPWAFEPHLAELAVAALAAGNHAARPVVDTLCHDPHRDLSAIVRSAPAPVAEQAAVLLKQLPRRSLVDLHIAVLGPLRLLRDGREVTDEDWVSRQRVRDLLMLLVEHRSIERGELAAMIWPDKSADAAARNLRFTLTKLMAVVEPDRGATEEPWYLRRAGSRLQLRGGDRLHIDVEHFERLLRRAEAADRDRDPERALEHYTAACSLYRGDYLTGASDRGWGYYEGLRLRGRFMAAAARASELLVATGLATEAEALAARAAECESDNEPAVRALATALLAQRRLGAARSVLGDLLERLRAASLPPEEGTVRVARRLGLAADRG